MSYPDKKKMCHRTGFSRSCRDLQDEGVCQGRWMSVYGKHPQTGADVERWGCVDDQLGLLSLEQSGRMVGIQAAVEARGNEQIKGLLDIAVQMQQMTHVIAKGIVLQQQQHDQALGFTRPQTQQLEAHPDQLAIPFDEMN